MLVFAWIFFWKIFMFYFRHICLVLERWKHNELIVFLFFICLVLGQEFSGSLFNRRQRCSLLRSDWISFKNFNYFRVKSGLFVLYFIFYNFYIRACSCCFFFCCYFSSYLFWLQFRWFILLLEKSYTIFFDFIGFLSSFFFVGGVSFVKFAVLL